MSRQYRAQGHLRGYDSRLKLWRRAHEWTAADCSQRSETMVARPTTLARFAQNTVATLHEFADRMDMVGFTERDQSTNKTSSKDVSALVCPTMDVNMKAR